MLTSITELLWRSSWQSAAVAVFVLLLQSLFGRILTPRWRHALWFLVLGRLLIPILPESRTSLFTPLALFHRAETSSGIPAFVETPPLSSVSVHYGLSPSETIAPRPPQFAQPEAQLFSTPQLLETFWLVVAVTIFVRLVLINLLFAGKLNKDSFAPPTAVAAQFDTCCRELNLLRCPCLIITHSVNSPAVAGALYRRVLLPASLIDTITPEQLRLIFLHELAHIKCHDVAIDWLWAALQSLYWFNPILWLVTPLRRSDREQARDAMVLNLTGPRVTNAYGQLLLQLAQMPRLPRFCPGLIGIVGTNRQLQRRIKSIAQFKQPAALSRCIGLALIGISASCALTNPKPTEKPKTSSTFQVSSDDLNKTAPADSATQYKLIQRMTFQSTKKPLTDVLELFRRQLKVDMYVDWSALKPIGVLPTSPVTVNLREIKASKALELVFKSVEGEEPKDKLAYTIDSGIITISTEREFDKNTITQKYDVNRFLPVMAENSDARQRQLDELIRYITDNVDLNSWKTHGGEAGSISGSPLRGVLLITATPNRHKKIQALLGVLLDQPPIDPSSSATQKIAPSTTCAVDENQVETRSYYINDLLFEIPNYDPLDPPKANEISESDKAGIRAQREDDLKIYLQANVAPSTWKETGRGIGEINVNYFRAVFSITQTNAIHREIQTALDQLRKSRGLRQISIAARFIELDEDTMQNLPDDIRRRLAYVASMKASPVQRNGKQDWDFSPVIATIDSGVEVSCMSCDAPEDQSVFVKIQPRMSRLIALVPEYWTGPKSKKDAVIQKPITLNYDRSLTCAIPSHETLLVRLPQTISDSRDPTAPPQVSEANRKGGEQTNSAIEKYRRHRVFVMITPTVLKPPQATPAH